MSFSRTKFTIREIIKIFDVVFKNPYKRNKNPHYWARILDKGIFPGRSVHSVNAQWQKFSLYENKINSVKKAIQLKMPYCVSFAQIPDNKQAIERIKQELFSQQKGYLASMNLLQKRLIKGESIEERALSGHEMEDSPINDILPSQNSIATRVKKRNQKHVKESFIANPENREPEVEAPQREPSDIVQSQEELPEPIKQEDATIPQGSINIARKRVTVRESTQEKHSKKRIKQEMANDEDSSTIFGIKPLKTQ